MIRNNGERCARCGQVAEGFAFIGDRRYCHGDLAVGERSCYEEASYEGTWLDAFGTPPPRYNP